VRGRAKHNLRDINVRIPATHSRWSRPVGSGRARWPSTPSTRRAARLCRDSLGLRPPVSGPDRRPTWIRSRGSRAISIEQKTTSRSPPRPWAHHGDIRLPAPAVCLGGHAPRPKLRTAHRPPDGGADCAENSGDGQGRARHGDGAIVRGARANSRTAGPARSTGFRRGWTEKCKISRALQLTGERITPSRRSSTASC